MAAIPFERQHARDYAAAMVAWFIGLSEKTAGRLTDFNDGSNIKTLFESVGLRFEALDNKIFLALQRLIPTIVYEWFGDGDGVTSFVGFPALPALPASGLVRLFRQAGFEGEEIAIAEGAVLRVPGVGTQPERLYTTIEPVTMAADVASIDILARCTTAGSVGNAAADTLQLRDAITTPSVAIAAATNPQAFLNGVDAETEEGRRQRWRQYIRNLARAPYAGLEWGAQTGAIIVGGAVVEQVLFARAVDVPTKRGVVDVYIDNGGGAASAELVAKVQMIIDGFRATDGSRVAGYKAAGVVARVKAVVPQLVPVTVQIALDPGFAFESVRAAVQTAIDQYVFGLGVFHDLVVAELIGAVATTRGVADVVVATPTANVTAQTGARLLTGAVTITAL